MEAPMVHDQLITLAETIVGPLLLINLVGLAKLASAGMRSVAGRRRPRAH
jgi:hypothetical protein